MQQEQGQEHLVTVYQGYPVEDLSLLRRAAEATGFRVEAVMLDEAGFHFLGDRRVRHQPLEGGQELFAISHYGLGGFGVFYGEVDRMGGSMAVSPRPQIDR